MQYLQPRTLLALARGGRRAPGACLGARPDHRRRHARRQQQWPARRDLDPAPALHAPRHALVITLLAGGTLVRYQEQASRLAETRC